MRFNAGCELSYRVGSPTLFIFSLEIARTQAHRDISDGLSITPEIPLNAFTVPGLENRYFSFVAPAGRLVVRYEAGVDLHVFRRHPADIAETAVADVPLDLLPFLLPSRYCPSDLLGAFAAREFGHLFAGHQRVTAICNWIYDNVAYQPGTSGSSTSATDTLIGRAGVCRDFAHLGIAFCRALNIPARFVSCYAHGLQPSDFHAVFEAYLDGRWWLFDATRQAHLDGLVRIGAGRDAAEVSFATIYGAAEMDGMNVWIKPVGALDVPLIRTTEAISTSAI
ncbi:Transglutaminase-like enzyme, putative cysteine protease [Faunimonas pinastri]|uniref:Transglutaminase-like enzyme, putative cysteine protease n=1 Tax=Faunimonas pinastri TaxID=1855383 RepID=A0A1H9MIF3_9HYPH|nr:transglutaminase family protein [Faunimonas pinastri]SER22913.1 Transglutaminase-like enzyme, putative cysteine protease [Faunimonas pinastri]